MMNNLYVDIISLSNSYLYELFLIFQPVAALQSHFSLMNELLLHVDKCRTDGNISRMNRTDYPNDNETLKDKLYEIQKDMYDIICSMKIALRGEGADSKNNVTRDVLSVDFLRLNWDSLIETYRAYKKMNDIIGIMDYLKSVYTHFADHLDLYHFNIYISPCIPLMQPNLLRHRLMQHFTKVGGNGER